MRERIGRLMGYPMTYTRVVMRNGLNGSYAGSPARREEIAEVGSRATLQSLIAGDLRRLEQDARDDHHIAKFAKAAGISKPKARAVLDAFFTDFGVMPTPWLAADPYTGEPRD